MIADDHKLAQPSQKGTVIFWSNEVICLNTLKNIKMNSDSLCIDWYETFSLYDDKYVVTSYAISQTALQ